VFLRLPGAILGGDLSREGRRLARALEALSARRRPGNRVALRVGDGDHRVVEGRADMSDARRNVLALATANARGFLRHMVILSYDINAAVMPAATPGRQSGDRQRQSNDRLP